MNVSARGWLNGLVGVAIFSGSLPATRLALGAFDPIFLTAARALIAALLAALILIVMRVGWPRRSSLGSLLIVAVGVVVGFPLLTALALTHITAARSVVFVGILPLTTALFGVFRGGERPPKAFWLFSALGSAIVVGFALGRGGGASPAGDALMVAAIVVCGLGYAEGATLARTLGAWQVICWALIVALPVTAALAIASRPALWNPVSVPAAAGLAYVSLFSMLIGFFFWYRGLAQGGTAAVGQLQLLQPFMGLSLSALVLGEAVSVPMLVVTVAVVACVAAAKRVSRQGTVQRSRAFPETVERRLAPVDAKRRGAA